ncbi:acyltransferase [Bacteroidota bacterium]
MHIDKEYKSKPYYEPSKNFRKQIQSGSQRRKIGNVRFLLTKLINEVLERLAFNCPVNSWRILLHRWRGVNIGENSFIGRKVTLDHSYPDYIFIGNNISLAGNNFVLTHSNPYKHFENTFNSFVAPVVIKDGAWISIGAMILPGVTIGENSVIAAGAVVTKDIPDRVIAGGIPAKVIKEIKL